MKKKKKEEGDDIPRLCPLILMVKVGWKRDQAMRSEEGKVTGSGSFGHVAEKRRSQYDVM
jgi:hypothetical protein